MKTLTVTELKEKFAEAEITFEQVTVMTRWLGRGDGIAVYQNQDMGHRDLGLLQFLSYGSPAAQLEGEPPTRLPDIGGAINWRYTLVGTFRGAL